MQLKIRRVDFNMEQIFLCGLDEAGRGPLAGPVSAGAVILPVDFPFEILNDSKKLSEKKREKAESIIKEKACWGLGLVDHKTIDRINILQSSLLAMSLAFEDMLKKLPQWCSEHNILIPDIKNIEAIADGIYVPQVKCSCRCEVKADAKYAQVMAASIIAKTARDKIMMDYDLLYPQYGYAKHKGYPTKEHKEKCRQFGPSPIQRLSFKY